MQVFLPYPDYRKSADVLDKRRKGKQRVDVVQILDILVGGIMTNWANHPFVQMWKGYELSLCEYGIAVCKNWITMGFLDNYLSRIWKYRPRLIKQNAVYTLPPFMGNKHFHASHRAALLYKGWLDLTCCIIPRPVNKWLKSETGMVKGDFKTIGHLKCLQNLLSFWPKLSDSFYALRTDWKEKPEIKYYYPNEL